MKNINNHKIIKLLETDTLNITTKMSSLGQLSLQENKKITHLYLSRINSIINYYQDANLPNFNILMIMNNLLVDGFLSKQVLEVLIKMPVKKRPLILEQLDQTNYLAN